MTTAEVDAALADAALLAEVRKIVGDETISYGDAVVIIEELLREEA